jgi:hypothetical protein
VDVSTSTTLDEPGTSAPSLGNIAAEATVKVSGTQGGTATINASSVRLEPATTASYGQGGGHGHHSRR